MNSNENDAMIWNYLLSEMNILVCYMPEMELRMQSYGTMNKGIWIWKNGDLEENLDLQM